MDFSVLRTFSTHRRSRRLDRGSSAVSAHFATHGGCGHTPQPELIWSQAVPVDFKLSSLTVFLELPLRFRRLSVPVSVRERHDLRAAI